MKCHGNRTRNRYTYFGRGLCNWHQRRFKVLYPSHFGEIDRRLLLGCYVAAKSVLPRWHHCSIKVWLDKDNRNYLWRRKNGYGYLVNMVALVTCIIRSYICLYICNVNNQLGKAKVSIYTYYRYCNLLISCDGRGQHAVRRELRVTSDAEFCQSFVMLTHKLLQM